jgi:hypothetical protein
MRQPLCRSRFCVGALVAALLCLALTVPASAQSVPNGPEMPGTSSGQWAVNLESAPLQSQPAEDAESFGTLRAMSPLQILGYSGAWAYVWNPRTHGTAYIPSDVLAPADRPSAYVAAAPPPAEEEIGQTGRVIDPTVLAVYPTAAEEAVADQLPVGTRLAISDSVRAEDGALWYRTADGDYVPAEAITFAPPPAPVPVPTTPVRTFAGRWIDVRLTEPTTVTAYQGSTPVRSMFAIHGTGRWATPTGTFTILRRVANETMDSSTVGIPRNGPGGYYLRNVLFTQYFTSDGASLHYNYWSSNFGYAGSHGCLGLTYADSAFLWNWAGVGTPVSIHY